jgi:hypothetical protein
MTKGFKRAYKDEGAGATLVRKQFFDTLMIGASEVQQHDGTYALDTMPAALAQHGMRANHFNAHRLPTVINQWIDDMAFRPSVAFRSFRRIRNVATGAVNPSTALLNLNNGDGAAADLSIRRSRSYAGAA